MVKEFPTLQGVIGKYYARESGEPPPVAEAIEEHYLPIGGRLPKTLIGGALAILDKYDTLTGYFGLGIEPTGDEDPFGLRRAAQGIVEVAWTIHRPLPLDQLLRVRGSMVPFLKGPPKAIADVGVRVSRYLFERLYTFAWPPPAPTADCVAAVLASPCEDLVDIMDRIASLQRLAGHDGLLRAAKVIERTHNILKGAPLRQPQVDPSRLKEPLERRLWDLYAEHQGEIERLAQDRSYSEATTRFGDVFFEPIHEFFEHVLVNVPEESLQQNRLALMKAVNALYTERIADLSKLAILHREETP
jgi:glycyl-tRNA synthetase beta chain